MCSDDTQEVLLSLISRMRGDNTTADAVVVPAITSDLIFFPLKTTTTETCYLKEIEPAANFSVNPSKVRKRHKDGDEATVENVVSCAMSAFVIWNRHLLPAE